MIPLGAEPARWARIALPGRGLTESPPYACSEAKGAGTVGLGGAMLVDSHLGHRRMKPGRRVRPGFAM